MSLLSSSLPSSNHLVEGEVTFVDPNAAFCSVKTSTGKLLSQVICLKTSEGDLTTPKKGTRVLVSTGLSYPLILGVLPRSGFVDPLTYSIDNGSPTLSSGNASSLPIGFKADSSLPGDLSPGDSIQSSEGGGMLGILREGTILAKASYLAQIIISKFNDLVRIVARNYDRISDFDQEASVNLAGRMYRFWGWTRNFERSKQGIYEYVEHFGDTHLSEQVGPESFNFPASNMTTANTVVRKRQFNDASGSPYYTETLEDLTGRLLITIDNTIRDQKPDLIQDSVGGVNNSSVSLIPSSVTIRFQGSVIVLNSEEITLDQGNGHYVHIDSSGVHLG